MSALPNLPDWKEVFPGKIVVTVQELSKATGVCPSQIIDLIEEVELRAVNIASAPKSKDYPKGNNSPRKCWRIPISSIAVFMNGRRNA
jgi:hypothetical protein